MIGPRSPMMTAVSGEVAAMRPIAARPMKKRAEVLQRMHSAPGGFTLGATVGVEQQKREGAMCGVDDLSFVDYV